MFANILKILLIIILVADRQIKKLKKTHNQATEENS